MITTGVRPATLLRGRATRVRPGRARSSSAASRAGTAVTAIIDHEDEGVRALSREVLAEVVRRGGTLTGSAASADQRLVVRAAHALVSDRVLPAYLLDERQPASRTLLAGEGSCSQRFAVLEAVLRASGIATRTHGLLVPGEFWAPRFPSLSRMLPREIPIAWPEVLVGARWLSVPELLLDDGQGSAATAFSNDAETLFDAVSHVRICWDAGSSCAVDGLPATSVGRFDSRDDFFDVTGETFCRLGRRLVEPIIQPAARAAR